MDKRTLTRRARRADEAVERGRRELVEVVREAHRDGMSEREIARAVGRSQPEVHRLIHFHGTSPGGLAVRRALPQVKALLKEAGMSNPRIFGSTARGEDTDESDVDLLVTAPTSMGLLSVARVENHLSRAVGRTVDLVMDDAIRPDLAESILGSAVAL